MVRLIVVRGRERECFEQLTQEFATDPGVRVIWDRRVARRRRQRSGVSTEQRQGERRALRAQRWTALGCEVGCERLAERVEDPSRHDAVRLLVIDDEPAVREVSCECLRLLGYDVEAARDGADGLAQLARERFDLVVTDLRMPQLDGWDVLESARAIAPGMPVIMVTGTAMDEDLERARAYGVRLLSKPCDLSELKAAVRDSLAPQRDAGSSGP
jgi:CheY-like chemotaxis protein